MENKLQRKETSYREPARIREALLKESKNPKVAAGLLEKLENTYRMETETLQDRIQQLELAPLQYAVIIAQCNDGSGNVLAARPGATARFEVEVESGIEAELLLPGREVMLNERNAVVKILPAYYSRGEIGEVLTILGEGDRLQVRAGGHEGYILELAGDLIRRCERGEETIETGDMVRFDHQLGLIFEKIAGAGLTSLALSAVPDVSYEMVGGLDAQIEVIRDAVELPVLYKSLFDRFQMRRPRGILLYGPPGCGKTMLAQALANNLSEQLRERCREMERTAAFLIENDPEPASDWRERIDAYNPGDGIESWDAARKALIRLLDQGGMNPGDDPDRDFLLQIKEKAAESAGAEGNAHFLSIKGPELLNKYVGETESSIRKAFSQAAKLAGITTPVIIFFDEIDAMFRARGSGISSDIESTIVPQFLAEMDGLEGTENIIVVGATNRPDLLDSALLRPGRFDLKLEVGRPSRAAAESILRKKLSGIGSGEIPIAPELLEEAGSAENALEILVNQSAGVIFDAQSCLYPAEETESLATKYGSVKAPFSELISGAIIDGAVLRAKRFALKRSINERGVETGFSRADLRAGIEEEFHENRQSLWSVRSRAGSPEDDIAVSLAPDPE